MPKEEVIHPAPRRGAHAKPTPRQTGDRPIGAPSRLVGSRHDTEQQGKAILTCGAPWLGELGEVHVPAGSSVEVNREHRQRPKSNGAIGESPPDRAAVPHSIGVRKFAQ